MRRYGYDASGELISQGDYQRVVGGCYNDPDYGYRCAYTGEVPVAGSIKSYAYDLVGNPTDAGTMMMGGNRMTQFGGDAIMYDPDGNVIQRQRIGAPSTFTQVLWWNSASMLDSVKTTRNGTTSTLQFAYDGNGRRIQKTVVGGAVTHYVWDGDQIVAETDASGTTQRLYTYFPGTDQLNSVVTGGKTYYAAQDAAGNVIGMIDWTQLSAKDKYTYQPFGTMDQNDQNVPNSMRWKGLLYDAESGLYYVRARYYAPEMRRFLSEDPIGLAGGINQYRFAENDPVNGSDPTGLDSNNDEDCTFSNYVLVCTPWINGPPPGAGIGLIEVAPVPSWDSPTPQSSFRGGPQATNPHAPIKYSAVVCPGFLATGPLRNGLEALYRLQTTTEQASVFQALPGGAIKQIVLTNPNSSSVAQTQLPGLLPVGTFTINHTHPKGPSFLQGPSRGDSIAAARTAMVALIIAPDSLFWMNPGGKSYGCAR